MGLFDLVSILLSLAALFTYFNHHFIGLPNGIGIMLVGLLMSLFLVALNKLGWVEAHHIADVFAQVY